MAHEVAYVRATTLAGAHVNVGGGHGCTVNDATQGLAPGTDTKYE